jgi:hypothetical protein
MPPPRAAKSTKVERPAGEAKCCPKCGHSFTDPGDLAEMTDTGQCIDCALKQPPEAAPPSVTTENLDNFKALHMAALEAWAQLRQRDTEACAEERANLARQAGEHARAIADLKAKLDITEIERDDARREVERLQVQVRGMAFGLVEYEAAHRNFEEQDGSDASGARLEAAEQAIIRLAAKVAP